MINKIEIIAMRHEGRISRMSDMPYNVSEIDQEDADESGEFFEDEYLPNLEKLSGCFAVRCPENGGAIEFVEPGFCSRRYSAILRDSRDSCLGILFGMFDVIDSFQRESSLFIEVIDASCQPKVEACLFYIGGSRKLYVFPEDFADRMKSLAG